MRTNKVNAIALPEGVRRTTEQELERIANRNFRNMRRHLSIDFTIDHRIQLCLCQDFTQKRSKRSINRLDVQQRITHEAHPETPAVLLASITQIPRSLLDRNNTIIFFVVQFRRFRHMANSAIKRHVLHKERHTLVLATFHKNILASYLDNFTDNLIQRSVFNIHRQCIIFTFDAETFLRRLGRFRGLFDMFANMNCTAIDRIIVAVPLQQQTQSIFERLIVEIDRHRATNIGSQKQVQAILDRHTL